MSSDASQSILRLTLLACATAAFMVVWSGESSRTVGMTLAERNHRIVPTHALSRPQPRTQLAAKPVRAKAAPRKTAPVAPAVTAAGGGERLDVNALPAGSYRVVFGDGRVEWLTVIDRNGSPGEAPPTVLSTTVRGEAAHVIRVSERTAMDSERR
jgi:hypothetical protein